MNDIFYRVRTKEEQDAGISPMFEDIKRRMKEYAGKIDVPEEQIRLLTHTALFTKRQFVIDNKKRLQEAIELSQGYDEAMPVCQEIADLFCNQVADVKYENTAVKNTHFLLDLKKRFPYKKYSLRYKAGWYIFCFEFEHDPYYRWRFCWAVELFADMVKSDEWVLGEDNNHCLERIRDNFFEYEDNPGRHKVFVGMWRIVLSEYKQNVKSFEWLATEIYKAVQDGRWQSRPEGEPSFCWKEPGERKPNHWYVL